MSHRIEFTLIINGPDGVRTQKLPVGKHVVGRQPGNQIVLANEMISRRHAELDVTAQECLITDLGSANGTQVNGEKITPQKPIPLTERDRVNIGPFELNLKTERIEVEDIPENNAHINSFLEIAFIAAQQEEAIKADESPDQPNREPLEENPPEPPAQDSENLQFLKSEPLRIPKEDMPGGQPPPPPVDVPETAGDEELPIPPGLGLESIRLINYLPGIYQTPFMEKLLGMFEAILIPIEWNISNFDLLLSPRTTIPSFLPWLQSWFGLVFDSTWTETQIRTFLSEAHMIFARRGTHWALCRALEIYTGKTPEIIDTGENIEPFTFQVKIPLRRDQVNRRSIEAIIDASKPGQTIYTLEFPGNG
ncbi:MAG TPA: FHA domain-containing protein [Anaerolineaceae bacterium]